MFERQRCITVRAGVQCVDECVGTFPVARDHTTPVWSGLSDVSASSTLAWSPCGEGRRAGVGYHGGFRLLSARRRRNMLVRLMLVVLLWAAPAHAVVWVKIGNPGNPPDATPANTIATTTRIARTRIGRARRCRSGSQSSSPFSNSGCSHIRLRVSTAREALALCRKGPGHDRSTPWRHRSLSGSAQGRTSREMRIRFLHR